MRLKTLLIAFMSGLISFGAIASEIRPVTPDPSATPGELCNTNDEDFVEYRYKEQIPYCERNVNTGTKTRIYVFYNVPAKDRVDYTIDHFIPLSLGGNNDDANLWPEHKAIKALRKNLEMDLYLQLSRGQITQKYAIDTIVNAKMHPPLDIQALEGVFYDSADLH